MKTIGLIGGMSWESSREYYSLLNDAVATRLGGSHSAKCVLYSFDFQEIEALQIEGAWGTLRERILAAGRAVRAAGADFAALCTNTMHKVTDNFVREVGIPLVHIVDAVGARVDRAGITRVGLLGTRFTMEESFYIERITSGRNLTVVLPNGDDRATVDDIIFSELVRGRIRTESKAAYERIMDNLAAQGAEAIILGCTEIGLLVTQYRLPLIDSVPAHVEAIIEQSFQ